MRPARVAAPFAALLLTFAMAATAFASGTVTWTGNGTTSGTINTEQCDDANPAGTMLWIFSPGGNDSVTSAELFINDVSYGDMERVGNVFRLQTELIYPDDIDNAYVVYEGSLGTGQSVLTISHYCPGETTTTTTTDSESTTTSSESTTTTTETTTTTTTTTSSTETETTTTSDTTTSDTTTSSTDTGTTTSDTTTTTESTGTETTGTETTETETTTTGTEIGETTTTTAPSGSVEELTPPSTDASAPTGQSGVSTGLLLVLAGILSIVLVATPALARSRRR